MAQIKKLQPGGTTPEKTTPKYGRLIQNGVEIQANDDMINWLAQQGYYGEQMANNLRSGDDQYLDTDGQGVGIIRNISVENPELKEKQQERTTRASRRLEGRRLNQARIDIQKLATYDYSKFAEKPKAKTPYKWDTLVIDYNPKEDGTKEFSNNQVNFDIIQRLDDLKNGLVIPEDQEFKDYDRVTQHYNNVKDLLEGTITRMRAGKLTADDEDILAGLGILATDPKTSSDSTNTTPENENLEYVIRTQMGISDKELANKMASEFTVGVNGRLTPKKTLSDRFGNNYWFSENDLEGYNKYAGYALLNGELVKVGSQPWKNWMGSAQGKSFVENYNLGAWNEAAKSMGFYGSNTEWDEYNPKTHYSSYFQPFTKYRDISGYYNLDGYLGVYDILSEIGENGLVTRKRIAIKNDGTIEDATAWNRVTATPQSYTTSAIHALQAIPNMDNTSGIPLTDDGKYWLVIAADGTKHVYQKNRVNSKYSEVTNLGDISKLSVGAIKDLIAQKVTGTWARAKRMQVGGIVLPATTPTQKIATPISDPTKPYSTKDIVNGVMPNLSDMADLLSLGLDVGGLISGEIPGLGEGLGYASDVASFVGDISRDGFQWGDVGNFVTNAGLTTVGLVPVIGTGTGVAKVLKSVKKLEPVLRGGFTAFGLYQGVDSLDNILSGDFTTEDLRHLLNGIMAVRGIYKNRKGHDLMDKYGESKTKTKTDAEVDGESLLKGLPKEKQLEIKKKAVDSAIKADNNVTTFEGNKVNWIDDSGKVIDYEKAWKGLRENGHITDKMLKENRSWFEGVKNEAGKAKSVVSEKAESGWEWLKRQIMPVDASQYRMRSNLTEDEIKALVNEGPIKGPKYIELLNQQSAKDWTIPSNKKGGRIRKCLPGTKLKTSVFGEIPDTSPKPDWVGLVGGAAEGLATGIANDKVHDLEQRALDIEAVGGQKSQNVYQPLQNYNINPLTTEADRNMAETWSRSNALASATADQRLKIAQHNFTASNVAKAEQNLLGNISKHITDVDLANTKLRYQYAKDEQEVADYNRAFGAQIGARKARTKAQYIKKQADNLIKQLAEARTDYNTFQNVVGKAQGMEKYIDMYNKWAGAAEGSQEKKEAFEAMQIYKAMMEAGGVRNPYTGIRANDRLYQHLAKKYKLNENS